MGAAELDELDRRRDAGEISANEYDIERARVLAAASKPGRSNGANVAITLAIVVVLIIVLQLALNN